ncbi:hypothetical protein B296_00055185, partial [Ensete ventricosum]
AREIDPPQRRWSPDPHGGSHGSQRGTIVRSRCKGERGSAAVSSSTDGSTTGGEEEGVTAGSQIRGKRDSIAAKQQEATRAGPQPAVRNWPRQTTCAAGASATPLPEEAGTHAGRASTEETTASIGDAGSTSELKIPREERRLRALEL